jgi:hypothetical protein
MRVTGIGLTGMALAVGGLLTIGVSDVAFAKAPKHVAQSKSCKGKNEALENGKCVTTSVENPDHIPLDATTEPQLYRSNATSHHHKRKTHAAPAAAAANGADTNAPNPGSNAPTKRAVARDRVSNPGRGDPSQNPVKATDLPF